VAILSVGRESGLQQANTECGCRLFGMDADATVRRAWDRLARHAYLPTQSHAFVQALTGTLLAGSLTAVLVALDVDGGGALLPLCREPGFFARWRAMGPQEVFEPVDALCADAHGARMLAEALAGQSRSLRIERMMADSPLLPALRDALRGKGLISVRPAEPTPTIALDPRWEDPESCFNSRRRSDFRRAARKAAEFGEVTFEIACPGPDEFDVLFDEAVAVEVRSWKKDAGTAIAVDREKEQFFREFFGAASREGTFRVAFMKIDGQAVAMQMAIETLGKYWLFKIGYDERFGKCSPGTLLMLHTLQWAARRGLQSYELLGHVEPWIAELWTRESRECVRLRTYPFGIRGMASLAADGLVWAIANMKKRAGHAA